MLRTFATLLSTLFLLVSAMSASGDDSLLLKPTKTLSSPDSNNPQPPVFINSDHMHGVNGLFLDAQDNVDLHRGVVEVTSDQLHYLFDKDQIEAQGNVCVLEQGLVLTGPHLHMMMKTQIGQMDQAQYTYQNPLPTPPGMRPLGAARGVASALQFQGPNQYQLQNATYTTCSAGNNDWYLDMQSLHLDMLNQLGTAHGAVVDFKQTPIFYVPWMSFPLNGARKSGVLAPIFGTTSNSGLSIGVPFYWNIAPNLDATITPDFYSKRGLEMDGEFRYLEPTYWGTFNGDYLQDHETNTTRWDIFTTNTKTFSPNLTGTFIYQAVSDNNFFRDLSNSLTVTSLAVLNQQVSLTYTHDWWTLTTNVEQYQTLQDPLAPIIAPYAVLPEINFSGTKNFDNGVMFNMYSDAATFVNPTLVSGSRFVIYPSLSLPINGDYGYITPKIGVNATEYQLGANNTSPQSQYTRVLPITSIDSGMYFSRDMNLMGTQYEQTLEPRLYYLYIPYQNQNNLPVFDTAALDPINYSTLFAENRYVGNDRINNANQLTMAVTSRLIDNNTGLERLRFSVGERLYFTPELVTLPGETAITSTSSDVLGEIGGQLSQKWRTDAAISYNTQLGQADAKSFSVSYTPALGKVFNAGYLYVNGQLDQYNFSAEWPFSHRWYGLVSYGYSILDKQIVQGLAGLEYNSGCWALRTVLQTFAIAANTESTSLFFQLELNGLGNLGSDPLQALQLSIPGYVNSNEIMPR